MAGSVSGSGLLALIKTAMRTVYLLDNMFAEVLVLKNDVSGIAFSGTVQLL